jgi:hypothetical protein
MGRPPVSMQDSTRIARARRVVRNAETAAEQKEAVAAHPTPANKPAKVVANTTDPQSRIMPTRRGFLQGYNAQVAVTSDQLIVAVQVGQSPNDQGCFTPMMRAAQGCSRTPARHHRDHRSRHRHRAGRRRLQQRGQPERQRPGPVDRPGQRTGPGSRGRPETSTRTTTIGCHPARGEPSPTQNTRRPRSLQASRSDSRTRHRLPSWRSGSPTSTDSNLLLVW